LAAVLNAPSATLVLASLPVQAQNTTTPCVLHAGLPVLRPIVPTHTPPPYPHLAQQIEEEGTTVLKVGIGADGTPTEVTVDKSSGALRLDSAAAAHVKAVWKWQPPLGADCAPVGTSTLISVAWHLDYPKAPDALPYTELDMAQSDYPPGAADRKEQGYVSLVVTVPPEGSVAQVVVSNTSGFPDLDAKALDIVKTRYRRKADEMRGKPVATTLGVLAVWTLPLPAKK
jgi:TonB family protein